MSAWTFTNAAAYRLPSCASPAKPWMNWTSTPTGGRQGDVVQKRSYSATVACQIRAAMCSAAGMSQGRPLVSDWWGLKAGGSCGLLKIR
jgi:hypothetical protein